MGTPEVDTKLIFTLWILCQVLQSSSFNSVVPDFFRRVGQRPESKKLSFHKGKGSLIIETSTSALLSDYKEKDNICVEM